MTDTQEAACKWIEKNLGETYLLIAISPDGSTDSIHLGVEQKASRIAWIYHQMGRRVEHMVDKLYGLL